MKSHYIDYQTMCISIPRWNLWLDGAKKSIKMHNNRKKTKKYRVFQILFVLLPLQKIIRVDETCVFDFLGAYGYY